MKKVYFFALILLMFGIALGDGLQAQEPRPTLAVLPLKEEGPRELGDVSETISFLVTGAFADSGAYQLVEHSRIMAALPDLKPQESDPAYRRTLAELGQRLGARFVLVGSYFPERNLADKSISVTVTLRLVDPRNGTEASRFMETAEGATLGSVVAALRRQLSVRAAGGVPVALPPVAAAAPEVPPAPAAAPMPVPVPTVAAPLLAPPAPAAPAPRKTSRVLLALREGSMNGVYFRMGGLPHYGARLEDFEFLPKSLAKLFPDDVEVTFGSGTRGAADDAALNRELVKSYQPDTLVVLTLSCRTHSRRSYVVMSKTQLQAELQVDFLAPATLKVLSSRTVQTDFVELKGTGTRFPAALKEQLARRLAEAIPALPE